MPESSHTLQFSPLRLQEFPVTVSLPFPRRQELLAALTFRPPVGAMIMSSCDIISSPIILLLVVMVIMSSGDNIPSLIILVVVVIMSSSDIILSLIILVVVVVMVVVIY